jgi:hypothetical protein
MESLEGHCFDVVQASVRTSLFRFRASSLQLLAGIQLNFIGTSITRRDAHIAALVMAFD